MSCYAQPACTPPVSVINRLTGPPDAPTTIVHGSHPYTGHALALTGTDITGLLMIALLAITIGVVILYANRRKRTA